MLSLLIKIFEKIQVRHRREGQVASTRMGIEHGQERTSTADATDINKHQICNVMKSWIVDMKIFTQRLWKVYLCFTWHQSKVLNQSIAIPARRLRRF
jgi:hypothetical protein